MKRLLGKSLGTILLAALSLTAFAGFELVREGRGIPVMVKAPSGGKELEKTMAFFNRELKRVSGVKLPIVSSPPPGKEKILFKLHDRPLAKMDAFSIAFPDKKTMVIEGTTQSVGYAFNHILEKHVGIRYFFTPVKGLYGPEINHYPRKRNIVLPRKSFSDKPSVYLYRCGSWRNQISRNWNRNMHIHGVHMMAVDVFPVWKYAPNQSWPKEILPVLNGKKFIPKKPARLPLSKNPYLAKAGYSAHFQFCWSHPKAVTIAVENIRELLRKNPERKNINLDVNDNGGFCQCKRCLKIVNGKRNSVGKFNYSEIYWKWVSKVAEEVSKTHPGVIFNAIAYTEVTDPPTFKLHKNVLPIVARELVAMLDERSGPVLRKTFRVWAERASMLGIYDYKYGEKFFLLPRVYLRSHSRILKDLIQNNKLRYAYFESHAVSPSGGPKQQLLLRVCWDGGLDVEKFLRQYYIDCVGAKAAPYLDKYYTFWENYWTGKDIKKTQWYRSVSAVYMQLGEKCTHTYALKKGDLQYARSLMEKVVALADTPDRKRRAEAIMKTFTYYELAATIALAEFIPPDGALKSAGEAVDLLKNVPRAIRALKEFAKHPMHKYAKNGFSTEKSLAVCCFTAVGKVLKFAGDPAVKRELERLAGRKDLPVSLRGQIRIMLGAKPLNLIENGDLEKEKLSFKLLWSRRLPGKRDAERASSGKYSYKMRNGFLLIHPRIQPGKSYIFLFDAYIEKPEVEGRVFFDLGPSKGTMPLDWKRRHNETLTPGVWNTFSETVIGHRMCDSLLIQFYSRNFDGPIWVDNFRLYCLDDIK